jgi:hypothetical protein
MNNTFIGLEKGYRLRAPAATRRLLGGAEESTPGHRIRRRTTVIYELRHYRVKKGKMKQWLKLMEEEIMPFQVSKGMAIPAMFTASKEKDLFVWLRRFKNEADRKRLYRAVYDTEHWKNVIQPQVNAVLHVPRIVVTDLSPTPRSVLQ